MLFLVVLSLIATNTGAAKSSISIRYWLIVGDGLLINLTTNNDVGLFGYLDHVHEFAGRSTALDKLNESIAWP